jgi:hypothetical protein
MTMLYTSDDWSREVRKARFRNLEEKLRRDYPSLRYRLLEGEKLEVVGYSFRRLEGPYLFTHTEYYPFSESLSSSPVRFQVDAHFPFSQTALSRRIEVFALPYMLFEIDRLPFVAFDEYTIPRAEHIDSLYQSGNFEWRDFLPLVFHLHTDMASVIDVLEALVLWLRRSCAPWHGTTHDTRPYKYDFAVQPRTAQWSHWHEGWPDESARYEEVEAWQPCRKFMEMNP